MDRSEFEKLLARQLDPNQPREVTLPSGMVLHVRKLTPAEEQQALGYMSHPDAGERRARSIIASIRYAVVDASGEPLNRSFKEAIQFINVLSEDDFAGLGEEMDKLHSDAAAAEVTDVDEAKNS